MSVCARIVCIRAALAALLIVVITSPNLFAQEPIYRTRMERFDDWLAALVHHTPGEVDRALLAFGAWRQSEWESFVTDAMIFSRGTVNPAKWQWVIRDGNGRSRALVPRYLKVEYDRMRVLVCSFSGEPAKDCPKTTFEGDLQTLWTRATEARQQGDPHYVLRLAALLQLDLASWGGTQDIAIAAVTPTTSRLWLPTSDGQGGDMRHEGIHWQIAYGLLDPIVENEIARGRRSADGWVRDWYVATSYWMQREGVYDQAHVDHALRYFPDDPELRFVSATLHEIDAGPAMQQAVRGVSLPDGVTSYVESVANELRRAASDLRRVIAGRPDWIEAHLRLGRVLVHLEKPAEAMPYLQTTLDRAPDSLHEYFAALYLGGIQQDAGRLEEAQHLYQRASDLFPSAQSPLVALSHVARQRGDRAAAQQAMQDAFERDDLSRDPWWDYLVFQARGAAERLAALRMPFLRTAD